MINRETRLARAAEFARLVLARSPEVAWSTALAMAAGRERLTAGEVERAVVGERVRVAA